MNLFSSADKSAEAITALKLDGILWINPLKDSFPLIQRLIENNLPVMIAAGTPCCAPGLNYAKIDFEEAGRMAAEYLLDQGHRKTVWLKKDDSDTACMEYIKGAAKAYEARNIPAENLFAVSEKDGAAVKLGLMLDLGIKYTAVFCAGNYCKEVRDFLNEKRLRAPEDISLIAEENIYSLHVHDCDLTRLVKPLPELGRIAAIKLNELVTGAEKGPVSIVCPWSLHKGGTCAAPQTSKAQLAR